MARKQKNDEIKFHDASNSVMQRIVHNLNLDNERLFQQHNNALYMTGFTSTFNFDKFNAKVDTYTIKQYEKDDFKNLIKLLTLWLDKETKAKVKKVVRTFKGDEFSEEDVDKFILALSLEIEDQNIRNKFEETHQYWKNIKR